MKVFSRQAVTGYEVEPLGGREKADAYPLTGDERVEGALASRQKSG